MMFQWHDKFTENRISQQNNSIQWNAAEYPNHFTKIKICKYSWSGKTTESTIFLVGMHKYTFNRPNPQSCRCVIHRRTSILVRKQEDGAWDYYCKISKDKYSNNWRHSQSATVYINARIKSQSGEVKFMLSVQMRNEEARERGASECFAAFYLSFAAWFPGLWFRI